VADTGQTSHRRPERLAAIVGALGHHGEDARRALDAAHQAREEALGCCRTTIRSCGLSIRAVHRRQWDSAADHAAEAEASLRRAQVVLQPFPSLAAAGFLHDAEKEYAEARLTLALVRGVAPDGPRDVGVGVAAWLNGLAEAASELRRHLLDRLRDGHYQEAEDLLSAMEEVYDLLVTVDYPDAVTGGLRRTTDALRAVLERSRADVTTTLLQHRLQQAIERAQGS
jgi:translin